MKTKILNALKTEYAKMGLGDKAFDGVATFLEKTITKEEEIDGVIKAEDTKALLKAFQGESDALRNRNAQLIKDFDAYKAAHPEDGGGGGGTEDPEIAKLKADLKKQSEELETLKTSYADQIKQGKYNALRDAVKGKANELKVSNVPIWNDVIAGVEVTDETTEDALLDSVKTAYEAKLKSYIGDGAAPYRGDGSTKPAEVSAEDKAKRAREDAERVRQG